MAFFDKWAVSGRISSRQKWEQAAAQDLARRQRTPARVYANTVRRYPATVPRGVSTVSRGGGELGSIDTTLGGVLVNTTPVLTLLNGCAPGTGLDQRIGRKTRIRSVQMRFVVSNDTAATDNVIRVALVHDKQPSGSAPAYTDIFAASSSQAMLNLDNTRRFNIIKSWYFSLIGNRSAPSAPNLQKNIDYYKKLNIPVVFNSGTAGTVADIESGALYLVVMGSNSAGTSDASMTGYVRVRQEQLSM